MKPIKALTSIILYLIACQVGICQLGDLPPNPSITKSIKGVQVEISIGFWMNPALLKDQIPPKTKLASVSSYGIPDSIISEDYQNWIDASLVIMAADSVELNGELTSSIAPRKYSEVFWWLQIEEGELLEESRAKGNNQAIELGYWVPDHKSAEKMNNGKWNAKTGTSIVQQINGGWRFSIQIEGCIINGSCSLNDEVKVENYDLPAFSTIWQPGIPTKAFTVYTFQGHKSQKCVIDEFEVQGDSKLAHSLKESIKIQNPYGVVMYGWDAKAAHYIRKK